MIALSERDKATFIMTVGISGSGKSFWLKDYQNDDSTIIVCPDNIREELTGNISDQTQNGKVWSIAKQRVIDGLNAGKTVILDATNVDGKSRRNFVAGLPPSILKAKIFNVDPKEAKRRIKKALENGENRSTVPENIVDKMHEKFVSQSTPEKLKEEGFELL